MEDNEIIIARPGQTLKDHLSGVSDKAGKLSAKIGLAQAGELIGLLHDFGKYSKQFQNYIRSAVAMLNPDADDYIDAKVFKGKIDHSSAGAQWIWKRLKKFGKYGQGELYGQILALCVASHHSGLIDCLKPNGTDNFDNRMEKDHVETHYLECCSNADLDVLKRAEQLASKDLLKEMYTIINPVLLTAQKGELIASFYLGFFARFLFSCLIDADRIDSASVDNPDYLKIQNKKTDWTIAINRFEEELTSIKVKNSIDNLRQKISNDCYRKAKANQGIYTLTVPTGGGKTFASLRYALHHAYEHKLDRIIYIIPYTSIIEQNAEAIRKKIERESDSFPWVLEHHSNLEPEKQTWHSKLASDNWESPIILTTMVQFLEILFGSGTRGVRRLHQLANSVLIFDEIQTIPINCVHLFCNAINFLVENAKTTVLLCTATQPLLTELRMPDKGQLNIPDNHELANDVDKLFIDLERVELINCCKPEGWKDFEITEFALREYQQKDNCLIIVNTKEWAQRLYRLCQESVPQEALFHLSTNQCPAHRKYLLNQIRYRLEKDLPVLCISTQLIEAGVDIDFSSVIRFLAGLDSIAQAAGRCNRNGNLKNSQDQFIKGTVYILNPDSEPLNSLVDIKTGRDKAERVLRELKGNSLLNPESITLYFKYYFFDRAQTMDYPLSVDDAERNDTLLNLLSSNPRNIHLSSRNGKFPLLRQSFMTAGKAFKALDMPTQAIIVQYEEGREIVAELCRVAKEFNLKGYYELLKKAQKYSVNVFPNVWRKLQEQEAVYEIQEEGIYYLDERYYITEFGLSTEPVGVMSSNII